MYNIERLQFIQKFQKEKGLDPLSIIPLNNKKTKIIKRNEDTPKRCDYLFQLSKVKKEEHANKINQQSNKNDELFKNTCTFKPVVNKRNNNHYYIAGCIIDNSIVESSIIERSNINKRRKEKKLEEIRQQNKIKELKECVFKPLINQDLHLKAKNQETSIENILIDDKAYYSYIKRIREKRNKINQDRFNEENKLGMGKNWHRGVTIIQEYNLHNKSLDKPKSFILSLQKPPLLTNYNKKTRNKSVDMIFKNQNNTQNYININKNTNYSNAIEILHKALITLDI